MNRTWNISLQQIQIFLKTIELKNFTKAADYFNFTPSMISKTITAMEEELQVKLFVRKPREFTPTPAGLLLAQDWRQLIGSVNNSILKARELQNTSSPRFLLGFVDSSDIVDALISKTVKAYTKSNPGIQVLAEKHDMHRAVELLNFGMLDVVVTDAMEIAFLDEHKIPWEKVCSTKIAAYVPRDNPLFEKESLQIRDFAGKKLIALDPQMHPSYTAWLYSLCEQHGFTPRIAATYRTVRSLAFNLRMSNAPFIGDSITSDWCDENLKQFDLKEESFSIIAWRPDASGELLAFKDFIKTAYSQND